MPSFLSATENVARQRQNVRRDLKKDEESRAVKLALGSHNLFARFLFLKETIWEEIRLDLNPKYERY